MRCPHFQKVNFQRIKEVKNDEATVQDQSNNEHMNYSIFSIQSISQDIYNIPQQGIENIHCLRSKMSNYKYTFNSMVARQDTIIHQSSKIKMPKQMNIKKMITTPLSQSRDSTPSIKLIQQSQQFQTQPKHITYTRDYDNYYTQQEQDGEIPSEHEYSSGRKNPHVLVSKTSRMIQETFQIFNGVVFLEQRQDAAYQCELKDCVIKVSRDDKIRYFIQLQKLYVAMECIEDDQRGLRLELKCKNKNDVIRLYFISPFQKEIFREVYLNCVRKIKQTRKIRKLIEHDKENYRNNQTHLAKNHNIDVTSYEEEESEILNENTGLNDEGDDEGNTEAVESISSLSMNSYEGDSLVFETQRMFFNQVRDTCNTFDILLFKNKSLMSKVQRIFTNSDYDHTAMLLKTANNQLLMLEATSNSGVAIYTFNSLLKIDKNKYFSRIGLRRYKGEKNLAKIARLENFIRKTVGKKYKFDPMYLIKSQANQEKDTFFCSELVAEALQDAGILSNQFPSFKYLPKHFAAQNLNNEVIDGKYSEVIILE